MTARVRLLRDRRGPAAWLSVFGLFVQLAVFAACAAAVPAPDEFAGPQAAAFPICHADPAGETPPPPPGHDAHCPFCAAGCQATGTAAPLFVVAAPVARTFRPPVPRAPFDSAPAPRHRPAWPRGPPATV